MSGYSTDNAHASVKKKNSGIHTQTQMHTFRLKIKECMIVLGKGITHDDEAHTQEAVRRVGQDHSGITFITKCPVLAI